MDISISLAIVTIILTVIFFIWQKTSDIKRHKEEKLKESQKRIDSVVNTYVDNATRSRDKGFSGMIRAGVAQLTDEEIRKACQIITERGQANPLGSYENMLTDINLKELFHMMAEEGPAPIESLIEKIKK